MISYCVKWFSVIPQRYFGGILISGMLGLLVGCGATYPDQDDFKNHIPGFTHHYYFTNVSYSVNTGAPVIAHHTQNDVLFFLIDQRDDIYYNEGFDVDFKKYDTRWFLQLNNTSTNYIFFSNTAFSSDVSFHYYPLGGVDGVEGATVAFTNGYLFITQADSRNWYVEAEVENGGVSLSGTSHYRLANYNTADESFSIVEN